MLVTSSSSRRLCNTVSSIDSDVAVHVFFDDLIAGIPVRFTLLSRPLPQEWEACTQRVAPERRVVPL